MPILWARITGRTVSGIDAAWQTDRLQPRLGDRFYIHLGMSGRLTIEPPEAAVVAIHIW